MAENTAQDELDLKPAQATAMFRLEMFATNFLLGYWRHIVAVVVAVLISVLVYGQWSSYQRGVQRAATAEIADALTELPAPIANLPEAIAAGQADLAKLESVGDAVMGVAQSASGTARVEGLLTAAELFRLSEKTDKQREALTAASEGGRGMLRYAAESGLANLELGEGQGDAAIARLRKLAGQQTGYLAEKATIDLALALEHLGKKDEAKAVYADFEKKFKDSKRLDEVRDRVRRLDAPAPEAAPAPTEAPPAEVPADPAAGGAAPAPAGGG